MDYPCCKFGDCSFSRFDSIVWTDTQSCWRLLFYRRLPRIVTLFVCALQILVFFFISYLAYLLTYLDTHKDCMTRMIAILSRLWMAWVMSTVLYWWVYWCVVELMCFNNYKCQNEAPCREDFPSHSYKCDCQPGYTGRHCETRKYSHYSFNF